MVLIAVVLGLSSLTPNQALASAMRPAAYVPANQLPIPAARPEQATPTPTPGAAQPPRRSLAGPIFGVALVFIASMLALGFAMGLAKRINAIAGPPPDDEDD
jgi:hypothetical protein